MALRRAWGALKGLVGGGAGAATAEGAAAAAAGAPGARSALKLADASPSARLDDALAQLASVGARQRAAPASRQPDVSDLPAAAVDPAQAPVTPDAEVLALARGRSPAELGALAGAFYNGLPAPPVGGGQAGAQPPTAGPPLPRDPYRATQLWVAAARKGDPASVFHTALCMIEGVGSLPRDRPRAEQLLARLADEAGHNWSALVLGGLLLARAAEAAGGGASTLAVDPARIPPAHRRSPDCDRAFAYLLRAAQANVAPAWLNVANCYAHGVGTRPDEAQAVAWLQKAALAGDPHAAVAMAARYEAGGRGVPREPRMAARMWRAAAEAGHPAAAHNVGVAYLQPGGATAVPGASPPPAPVEGGSGGVDYAAALVWFLRAGGAGFVRSQVNAGAILASGAPGVPRDAAAARHWLTRARETIGAALRAAPPAPAGDAGGEGAPAAAQQRAFLVEQLADVDARLAALQEEEDGAGGGGEGGAAPATAALPRLAAEPATGSAAASADAGAAPSGAVLSPADVLGRSAKAAASAPLPGAAASAPAPGGDSAAGGRRGRKG